MFVFIKRAHLGMIGVGLMRSKSAAKKGMTLIEVLIALVILTVGVSSMMVAMSRCLSVVRTARNREVARGLLRRVDIENPIDRKTIEETDESGDFEDLEGYTWSRVILMVDEEERPGLFLVTTRVQWAERGRDAFEEITTYNYAPDTESVTKEL
jgi:prepilin-type N-terminal cleavage/methylation domain-containing protein